MFRLDASLPATPGPRQRLFDRVARSAAAARVMHTVRHGDAPATRPAPGVSVHTLYGHGAGAVRHGEPLRTRLVALDAGACWQASADVTREWLVLAGALTMGELCLREHDFHRETTAHAPRARAGAAGALLLLREAPRDDATTPHTQLAAHTPWQAFAPGIERRVLWQRGSEAAMLYRVGPDAAVPRHAHGHDEECLLLQGELFLDDVLLRPLDYQLAPAGSGHAAVSTETGALVYAHGDVELEVIAE